MLLQSKLFCLGLACGCLLLCGCQKEKVETTSPKQGAMKPEAAVDLLASNSAATGWLRVGNYMTSATLVSPYEIRLTVQAAEGSPSDPPAHVWGDLTIEGVTTEPIPFVRIKDNPYLCADLPATVTPPVNIQTVLYAGGGAGVTSTLTLRSIEPSTETCFTGPSDPSKALIITSARGEVDVASKSVNFSVSATNSASTSVYLTDGTIEVQLPWSTATSQSLELMDNALLRSLKPGEYDMLLRGPNGRARAKGVIQLR